MPNPTLRDYQIEAVEAVQKELETHRSTMVVMATGLGKTEIFCEMARRTHKRVLVLAHRTELVDQAKSRIDEVVGGWCQVERAGTHALLESPIVVASVQTIQSDARLKRFPRNHFGLIITDECFPAGTLISTPVGKQFIETIRVGDAVLSVNHANGSVESRTVTRLFKNPCKTSMVEIQYGATAVRCTANHPIFVKGKGYVQAGKVKRGDLLCVWERGEERARKGVPEEDLLKQMSVSNMLKNNGGDKCKISGFYCKQNDKKQPHAQPYLQRESQANLDQDGSQATGVGGERKGHYETRKTTSRRLTRGRCDRYWVGQQPYLPHQNQTGLGVSQPLQTGPGSTGVDALCRGRRILPQHVRAETAGYKKGEVLTWKRVDGTKVYEQASRNGDGVYNFGVEGNHNYFANNILVHNCHHFVSRTFGKPLEYFSEAKLLGVTATPDRLDKKGLCSIVESVAYKMDIKDGIDRGWLVPLKGRLVKIDEIDLSAVKKTAGDLQVGELDLAILRAVEGIVQKTMDISGDRQAIVFFPGVASAQFATDRFNFLKPDCAAFIGAKTSPIERAHIVHQFKTGRVQYLCNCQVATEGFDAPRCSVIAIARPTLSRALYTQMVGRGVRPHGMPEGLARDERKGFIATSGKPNCLILDFAGNSGKYSLMSPADVLGADRFTPEEIKQAKKQDEEDPDSQETDPEEGLKQAREELERLARLQKAKVKATEKSFDPFAVLHLNTQIKGLEFGWEPMSPKQRNALLRFGVEQKDVTGYSKKHAKRVLDAMFKRKSLHLASYKQLSLLKKYGHTNPNISAVRASKAIDVIVNSGRDKLDRSKLDDILNK